MHNVRWHTVPVCYVVIHYAIFSNFGEQWTQNHPQYLFRLLCTYSDNRSWNSCILTSDFGVQANQVLFTGTYWEMSLKIFLKFVSEIMIHCNNDTLYITRAFIKMKCVISYCDWLLHTVWLFIRLNCLLHMVYIQQWFGS